MPVLHSGKHLSNRRRAAAEVLALTVKELFPEAVLVGGEKTEIGFFYDFIFEQPLHDQALTLIEVRMRALIKEDLEVRSLSMMRDNAPSFFQHHNQPILAERSLQEELNLISLIQIGEFYGLCPDLSIQTTGEIGTVKLLEAIPIKRQLFPDEEKVLVTRIMGTAFEEPQALKKFLKSLERLKKKDHRLLGRELDLFSTWPNCGQMSYFWHPKGEILRQLLLRLWHEYCDQRQAQQVTTPLLVKQSFLQEKDLFPPLSFEGESYRLSHTRLLHHIQLFKRRSMTEAELPVCFAEYAQNYESLEEFEEWGLFRSYSYAQDQMTVFCTEDQVFGELISSLQFIKQIVRIFGFENHWYLSISGQKNAKNKEEKKAIDSLIQALEDQSLSYVVEEVQDHSTWRGPYLENRLTDSLGREWTGM